jgi:phosphoribosylformylglycinamidine cyclo-ligase
MEAMIDAYAAAGVDTAQADAGVRALVDVLRTIDIGRPSRSVLGGGHYAAVLEIAPGLGLALCTDGVGSKLILAEQLGRLDTVGVDCVAMNVNDIICVGAEPVAMLDYIAVEAIDAQALAQIASGLKRGAELAGVEIPGGELAVLPELIRGHPSPHGFELSGTAVGTVSLDRVITGAACAPGDSLIGLPSSGLHSNGYTLARRLRDGRLGERPASLGGASVGEALLEPTAIYVRAVLELLGSGADVRGLAHITGDGVLNLRRLNAAAGFTIEEPLAVAPICSWLCEAGSLDAATAYQVFNMGCGFVACVGDGDTDAAVAVLERFHPGARVIGHVDAEAGRVSLPGLDVVL